jgi:hypothetical protein
MNRHCFPPSLDVRYAVGRITFLLHNTCAEVHGKVRLMHQAFAPRSIRARAVKGIDGDTSAFWKIEESAKQWPRNVSC